MFCENNIAVDGVVEAFELYAEAFNVPVVFHQLKD